MSKGNTTEADIVAKVFRNTALPWDANTDLYISLHTADPGEAGDQTTSEAAYTSYARVTVARDATGWDIAGSIASNDDLLQFPEATGGSAVCTHIAIGTTLAAAGQILYSGALNATRTITDGIQPQIVANGLTIAED